MEFVKLILEGITSFVRDIYFEQMNLVIAGFVVSLIPLTNFIFQKKRKIIKTTVRYHSIYFLLYAKPNTKPVIFLNTMHCTNLIILIIFDEHTYYLWIQQ